MLHVPAHGGDGGRIVQAVPVDAVERENVVRIPENDAAPAQIGLMQAIAKLARGMRGDLTVRSVLGAGSTFTLRIPSLRR